MHVLGAARTHLFRYTPASRIPIFWRYASTTASLLDLPIPLLPVAGPLPTPAVTAHDIDLYLQPLYRRGWESRVRHLKLYSHGKTTRHNGKALIKRFAFNDTPAAFDFFKDMSSIAKAEHQNTFVMTLALNTLKYATLTTKALSSKAKPIASVTRRDIRVALQAETTFVEKYASTNRAPTTIPILENYTGHTSNEKSFQISPEPPTSITTLSEPTPDSLPPMPLVPELASSVSLVDEDFTTYLKPLYLRRWKLCALELDEHKTVAVLLYKTFSFQNHDSALKFAISCGDLAVKETESFVMNIHANLVYIYTSTRMNATKCTITMRDVSIAMRIEEMALEMGASARLLKNSGSEIVESGCPRTVVELESFETKQASLFEARAAMAKERAEKKTERFLEDNAPPRVGPKKGKKVKKVKKVKQT